MKEIFYVLLSICTLLFACCCVMFLFGGVFSFLRFLDRKLNPDDWFSVDEVDKLKSEISKLEESLSRCRRTGK